MLYILCMCYCDGTDAINVVDHQWKRVVDLVGGEVVITVAFDQAVDAAAAAVISVSCHHYCYCCCDCFRCYCPAIDAAADASCSSSYCRYRCLWFVVGVLVFGAAAVAACYRCCGYHRLLFLWSLLSLSGAK